MIESNLNIPIFIINLEKDIIKKEHIKNLCNKFNLLPEFIPAIDGRLLSDTEIELVYSKEKSINIIGRELSKNEIGCALSHKNVYQKIIDENIYEALIFEDDIEFDNRIKEALNKIKLFPDHTELVLLGYWYKNVTNIKNLISYKNRIKINNNLKLVRFISNMHGTYGYYININGARSLLNTLNTKFSKPIDHYTSDEKIINVYGIYPPVINACTSFDINTDMEKQRVNERLKYKSTPNKKIDFLKYMFKKTGTFKVIRCAVRIYRTMTVNIIYFYKRLAKLKEYE